MIPSVPARRRNDRRRRVPTTIPDNRLPLPTAAIVIVPVHKPFVLGWPRVQRRGIDVDRFRRERAVKVPDVDLAVVGAGVDVPAVSRGGRRKVATDEGLEHAVPAECDERAVVWVGFVVFGLVG